MPRGDLPANTGVQNTNAAQIGAVPQIVISGTSATTPAAIANATHFFAIKALTDVVINTATGAANVTNAAGLAGKTILAGDVLIVGLVSITLTSGTAIAYAG